MVGGDEDAFGHNSISNVIARNKVTTLAPPARVGEQSYGFKQLFVRRLLEFATLPPVARNDTIKSNTN
jgi:hypothetical protein